MIGKINWILLEELEGKIILKEMQENMYISKNNLFRVEVPNSKTIKMPIIVSQIILNFLLDLSIKII